MPEETGLRLLEQNFELALAAIPSGYGEGVYEALAVGVTVRKSCDGKRTSLFARALAGRRRQQLQPLPAEIGRGLLCPREGFVIDMARPVGRTAPVPLTCRRHGMQRDRRPEHVRP